MFLNHSLTYYRDFYDSRNKLLQQPQTAWREDTWSLQEKTPGLYKRRHLVSTREDTWSLQEKTPCLYKRRHLVSTSQKDFNSCGVFGLMNAFGLLEGIDLQKLTQAFVQDVRHIILQTLIKSAGPSPATQLECDIPGCQAKSKEKTQCCICGRWAHWQHCAKLQSKPKGAFICTV
ncbi:hypothetical protein LSAT2_013584, partial [Lamellibrachia satsuma]